MVRMSTWGSQKSTSKSIQGVIINHPNGTDVYMGVPKDYIYIYTYINSRYYYQPP